MTNSFSLETPAR